MNKTILALLSILVMFPIVFAAGLSGTAPIPTPPGFQITSSLTTLCKGSVNYIPVKVTNTGALGNPTMQSVILTLSSTRGLTPFGATSAQIANITSSNSNTVRMSVLVSPNASSVISTGVNIGYYFYQLYSDSETRNLTFSTVVCPTPLAIQVYPRIITKTGAQNLTFNLTNNGKTNLSTVSVGVSISGRQGIALLGNQPQPVMSLRPNQTANVKQQIYVSLQNISQMIPVNVSVNFYNGSNLNQIFQSTFLLFGGIINMTPTSITTTPAMITSGSTFSISFVLTNTGTSAASSVTATAIAPSGFTHYGTTPTFVGSVAADSQTPVTLSLITGANVTSGTYNIPVKITYLDELRNSLTSWVNVSVSVHGSGATPSMNANGATVAPAGINASRYPRYQSGSGFLGTALIVIVVVVAAALAFLFMRRRNKRKQDGKK
jgi:uncharacterized membrane protein